MDKAGDGVWLHKGAPLGLQLLLSPRPQWPLACPQWSDSKAPPEARWPTWAPSELARPVAISGDGGLSIMANLFLYYTVLI